MAYKDIRYFRDLQDDNHAYKVGDIFPHDGRKVMGLRIAELAGSNNKQHTPLIKKVVDEPKAVEVEEKPMSYTKQDIARMNKAGLEKIAKDLGIDTTDTTNNELRELIGDRLFTE